MHAKAAATLLLSALLSGCTGSPPSAGDAGPMDSPPAAGAVPLEWGSVEDAVLRPGAATSMGVHQVPGLDGGSCTLNFVFTDANGTIPYVGTAAHCIDVETEVGGNVSFQGDGADFVTGQLRYHSFRTMNTTVERYANECGGSFTLRDEPTCWNDFALVAFPPDAPIHPRMKRFGGPTGPAAGAAAGDVAYTFGRSYERPLKRDLEDSPDARAGLVKEVHDWFAVVQFTAPGMSGDSGSPVLGPEGVALGIITVRVIVPEGTNGGAMNGVMRLDAALDWARENAGIDVRLATWPEFSPLPTGP